MSIRLVNSDGEILKEIRGEGMSVQKHRSRNAKTHNIKVYDKNTKSVKYMDVITYSRIYGVNVSKLYRHLNKNGFLFDEDNMKYLESLKDSHVL